MSPMHAQSTVDATRTKMSERERIDIPTRRIPFGYLLQGIPWPRLSNAHNDSESERQNTREEREVDEHNKESTNEASIEKP